MEEEGVNDTSITLPEPPAGLAQNQFDAWVAIDDDVLITEELTKEDKIKSNWDFGERQAGTRLRDCY